MKRSQRLLFDDVLYDVIFFLPIVNLLKLNWSNRRLYEIMERHKAIEMSPRIIRDIVINEEGFKVLRPKGSDEKWKMVVPPLPGSQLPAEILGFHCIKLDMEAIKESHSNPNQIVSQARNLFAAIAPRLITHKLTIFCPKPMQSIMPTFQRFLVVELQMAQFSRALGETFIRAPAVIATPRLRISDNFSTKMELSLPIIKDIIHWLFSPSNEERILWLGSYGNSLTQLLAGIQERFTSESTEIASPPFSVFSYESSALEYKAENAINVTNDITGEMLSVEKRSDPLFGINGFLLRRQSRAIPSRPSEEISPELFEFDRIREVRIE